MVLVVALVPISPCNTGGGLSARGVSLSTVVSECTGYLSTRLVSEYTVSSVQCVGLSVLSDGAVCCVEWCVYCVVLSGVCIVFC